MKKFAALAILALLTFSPWRARAMVGALEGTVRDAKTSQPVSGAQVQLKIPSAGKVTVTTDASGRFIFNSIPAGAGFSLKVSKSNYDEWKGDCPEIKDGSRVKKDISINPAGSSAAGGGGGSVAPAGGGGGGGGGRGKGGGGGGHGKGGGGGDGQPVAPMPGGSSAVAGTVSGVITSGGQPLAGVSVKVGDKTATSAGNGSYTIKLPAGIYTVEARKDGFKKFEGNVTISPGSETSRNIDLKPKK